MSSLPAHLQGLNERQYEAVTHEEGPLLVFAGAGSGKTRVLTRRIANLIFSGAARPYQIFAVTFTNKAAREMKERVSALVGQAGRQLWVSTFHSACARILRQHAKKLDYTENFAIYDTQDSLALIKRIYKNLKLDTKTLEPKTALSIIDTAKNEFQDPEAVKSSYYFDPQQGELASLIYRTYQDELLRANAMDFGDLIFNVLVLFKLEPEVLRSYQQQFKYLLIDEYQDTNRIQYLLIKALTGVHKNICVVGDDDQSIYAFRGANIENILNFKKDFPDAHIVTLDINYRSTQNIVAAANKIIAENKKRQAKDIRTLNAAGEKIVFYSAADDKEEADFVATEISKLLKTGEQANNIAVFYRTNSQSRSIEESLLGAGIDYEIYGGFKFYDRKEIKDILCYYRLILNEKDNEAFLRIINTPTRGIGPSAVSSIANYATKSGLSLYPALQQALQQDEPFLTTGTKKKLTNFISIIEELKADAQRAQTLLETKELTQGYKIDAIAELVSNIAQKSGYIKKLKDEDSEESLSRIENINELARVASEFVAQSYIDDNAITLRDFLERTSLSSGIDFENAESSNKKFSKPENVVSLMTLHLAKGLEFDYVFLVGMEEGLLPHSRSIEENDIEEERRLCYVGVTRAKKKLFLTLAEYRNRFGRSSYYDGTPSRFLDSIPQNLLEYYGSSY